MTAAVRPPGGEAIDEQYVEAEHRRLRVGLANLGEAIEDAHRASRAEMAARLVDALRWLRHDVLPHAAWEEAWLYPAVDRLAGTAWATRSYRLEHAWLKELAQELEVELERIHDQWSLRLTVEVVAALARLEAVLSLHLAEEERFALPVIEAESSPARPDPRAALPAGPPSSGR
jgi:iron-sulfur cluster repair protein YtfE (RIC family)